MKKKITNFIFYFFIFLTGVFFFKVLIASSFKIPSDSMSPELIAGDYILVNKLAYGARLFDIFLALAGERVSIYRAPGFSKVKRNDILVSHAVHPKQWGKVEMNMMKYYIKRCIGIPGDTVCIVNSFYLVNGTIDNLGNTTAQKKLSIQDDKSLQKTKVFFTFPEDSILNWTIKNFGPFYIPKKGDTLKLDRKTALLYKKNIEWEIQQDLILENDTLWRNRKPLLQYTFTHDYYFMAGDRVINSQDSRYWGLLPDDFIVGKAVFIWKSKDLFTGKYRWNRFMKRIK